MRSTIIGWVSLLCLMLSTPALAQRLSSSPYLDSYLRNHGNPGAFNLGAGGGYRHSHYRHRGRFFGGIYFGLPAYSTFGYGYGYPYAYPPYYLATPGFVGGPYVAPPLYLPAETMYGPQAVQRFFGITPQAPRINNIIVAPRVEVDNDVEIAVPRVSNAESRARAWRFVEFGDQHFANQKFHSALARYKKAEISAPDVAEVFFRQGHALAALGRYDLAADAYRRGLKLDPHWPDSGFQFDTLYAGGGLAKQAHREALAEAAAKRPGDPDLLFVLGVLLHFDGEPERALPFFRRAHQLELEDRSHLDAFVARVEPGQVDLAPEAAAALPTEPNGAIPEGLDL